jgi:hypothetical protein
MTIFHSERARLSSESRNPYSRYTSGFCNFVIPSEEGVSPKSRGIALDFRVAKRRHIVDLDIEKFGARKAREHGRLARAAVAVAQTVALPGEYPASAG